jgi:hypothetical protein
MIALVVAPTSPTLVTRRPATLRCRTRVHTFPDAFATSIAATRCSTSAPSSTSIPPAQPPPGHPLLSTRADRGTPEGLGQGTEILIRVLQATARDPLWSGPGTRLFNGLDYQGSVGVAGDPPQFSRRHDAPTRAQGDCLHDSTYPPTRGITSVQQCQRPGLSRTLAALETLVHSKAMAHRPVSSQGPARISRQTVAGAVSSGNAGGSRALPGGPFDSPWCQGKPRPRGRRGHRRWCAARPRRPRPGRRQRSARRRRRRR